VINSHVKSPVSDDFEIVLRGVDKAAMVYLLLRWALSSIMRETAAYIENIQKDYLSSLMYQGDK
jgi:hypothetical protein